jgi:hypothetical protein
LSRSIALQGAGLFSARRIPDFEQAPLPVIAALVALNSLDRDTAYSVVDRIVASGNFSPEAADAWFKGRGNHSMIEFEEAFACWLNSSVEPVASNTDAVRIVAAYTLLCFVNNPSCRERAMDCITDAEMSRLPSSDEPWIVGELYWYNLKYENVLNAQLSEARSRAEFEKLDANALALARKWLAENEDCVSRLRKTPFAA